MARPKQTTQKSGEALQGASYKRPSGKNLTMKAPHKIHFVDSYFCKESLSPLELSDVGLNDKRNAGNGTIIPMNSAGTGHKTIRQAHQWGKQLKATRQNTKNAWRQAKYLQEDDQTPAVQNPRRNINPSQTIHEIR